MAGSLKTAFYNLVKYAANDITSWLTDFNGNMDKIDRALNQNKTAVETAQDSVDNLESEYDTMVQTLAQHTTAIDNNEKAIAENSASIAEIEDELSDIIIGEYYRTDNDKSGVTKVETLCQGITITGRRVGNGIDLKGGIRINAGTLHTYDRQVNNGVLNGLYATDLYRITGNPFNLPANSYIPVSFNKNTIENISSLSKNVVIDSNEISGIIAYLTDSGYTVICLVSNNTTQYNLSNGDYHEFVIL